MKPYLSLFLCAATLTLLIACDSRPGESAPKTDGPSMAFASNYPLAYFIERITGDSEQIYFPQIDGDPAFWNPTPEQISRVQECDPLFLNGATYEKWRKAVTLPDRRIIDTSSSFQKQFIEIKDIITHQHGPDGDHSHSGTAFTTWIDFSQAVQQAESIKKGLAQTEPETATMLDENLADLKNDLNLLDKELHELTANKPKPALLGSHPIYQYFARAYDLNITTVLWEPDVYPNEEQWQALEEILTTHPAKWMIWEGPPLDKSAQRLKEMGLGSVVFDPCANTPDSGDFFSVMKQNIENLRPVFSK